MKLSKKQIRELQKRLLGKSGVKSGDKAARKAIRDAAREEFVARCLKAGLPKPIPEFYFHPTRRWRFDWLFGNRVAVEIQGGVWVGGRHSGGEGQIADMEKFNEAQILGYVVLQFTPKQIEKGEAFPIIKRALEVANNERT